INKDRLAGLPLFDVYAHATLRLARTVEGHGALDRLVSPRMQGGYQLRVLDAVRLFGRLLDHLADTVGLGGVGADVSGLPPVLGNELADELAVAVGGGGSGPAGRHHHAFGSRADLVGEVLALVRAGGFDQRLGI